MTKKTEAAGPSYMVIDGEQFEIRKVADRGMTFTVRELSVEESDVVEDASRKKDGSVDYRLSMRLALVSAIVDPPTTIEHIAKWPGRRYVLVSRAFNALNVVGPESDPNDSRQSGPNDSTSPTSGESSPET